MVTRLFPFRIRYSSSSISPTIPPHSSSPPPPSLVPNLGQVPGPASASTYVCAYVCDCLQPTAARSPVATTSAPPRGPVYYFGRPSVWCLGAICQAQVAAATAAVGVAVAVALGPGQTRARCVCLSPHHCGRRASAPAVVTRACPARPVSLQAAAAFPPPKTQVLPYLVQKPRPISAQTFPSSAVSGTTIRLLTQPFSLLSLHILLVLLADQHAAARGEREKPRPCHPRPFAFFFCFLASFKRCFFLSTPDHATEIAYSRVLTASFRLHLGLLYNHPWPRN